MRARCRRSPDIQSTIAECDVTRFCSDASVKPIELFQYIIVTYIPNDHSLGCPANTRLIVDASTDMSYKKGEQGIALLLLQPDNAACDF